MELRIDQIQLHQDLQSRASMNMEHVEDLVEALQDGKQFKEMPVVFHQDNVYWLADGFHRLYAYQKVGVETAEFDVRQGGFRDAKLHSIQSNTSHGLKRSNADKRRAVEMLLKDEEWSQRSDRWIAEIAGVSHPTVLNVKAQVVNFTTSPTSGNFSPEFKTGKDGKKQPAAKKKQSQPELYHCKLCMNSFTEKEGDCPRCFPPEEVEVEQHSEEDPEFEEMFKVIAESFQQMIFDARTQWTDKQLARLRKEVENLFTCAVPASHMEV